MKSEKLLEGLEVASSLKSCSKVSEQLMDSPRSTPGCSMLKFARLDDAFLEVFNRKQAQ